MQKSCNTYLIVMLAVLFLAGASLAEGIFFWQHDNNLRVTDRVFNSSMTSTQSLTRTLNELDLDFDLSRNMPEDLSEYDLVMTSLSFYCPG